MLGLLSYLAVVVIVMTSLFLLISQNWRWNIIALAVQYLALMILTAMVWPIGMAAVKLIAGWMAGAMLSASQPAPELVEDPQLVRSAVLFRFLAAMLVWILVFTIMPIFSTYCPCLPRRSLARCCLSVWGLLHLGNHPPAARLDWLAHHLSGFELIYAAVENSVLVTGLLAIVTLGLALVGAYLLETLSRAESGEEVS
jgi:hypothetical protein